MATEAVLGIAQIPIRAVLDELDKDLAVARGKVEGSIGKVVKNIQTIGGAALTGIGVVTAAATGAAVALGKIAIDAAPVEGLKDAFGGLAKSSGQNADALLAALQKGSSGMVAQRDLMKSYNQAAQLVSTTFANQLPDAMGYLGKVSAATGQGMGFLLDSLVKGVGRLSPMILDNLAIQVSLEEATGRAAAMYGVEEKALTKAQTQAGMMAVVMEKLAANTAAMPDVSKSAAAGLARVKATAQDLKDKIGLALLPALSSLLGAFAPLLEKALPMAEQLMGAIAPPILKVADAIGLFIEYVTSGFAPLTALEGALYKLFPPDVAKGIMDAINWIVTAIQQVIDVAGPYIEQAMAWISQNVQLKDVLIALGIAIAAVVLPALWSVVAAAAPVIAAGLLLIAAVVAIRKAWESDFLGIRTFVLEALAAIQAFWAEHGEAIMAKAQEIWEAIKVAVSTAIETVRVVVEEVLTWIKEFWAAHGEAIMAKAKEIWDAVVATFEWFKEQFVKIFEAFRRAFEGDWYGFGAKLREVWDEAWAKIKELASAAWEAIKKFFTETDWGAVGKGILEGIAKGITSGLKIIKDAAWNAAKAALEAAKGFLGITSPSTAFAWVGSQSIQGWAKGLMQTDPLTAAVSAAAEVTLNGAAGTGGTSEYHLHVYSAAQAENLMGDFNSLRAMAGA